MKSDSEHFYKVADKYISTFHIPVLDYLVAASCRVVKTKDQLEKNMNGELEKVHIIEMHFVDLSSGHRVSINDFLAKIGQKQ